MSTAPRAWLRENGAWKPGASLPFTDRAVRYGMSVFDTIGIRNGQSLLLAEHLELPPALSEAEAAAELAELAADNRPRRAMIGLGYHGTITPGVVPGQPVARGQSLGVVAARGGHCGGQGCLHVGLRREATYLDPTGSQIGKK